MVVNINYVVRKKISKESVSDGSLVKLNARLKAVGYNVICDQTSADILRKQS